MNDTNFTYSTYCVALQEINIGTPEKSSILLQKQDYIMHNSQIQRTIVSEVHLSYMKAYTRVTLPHILGLVCQMFGYYCIAGLSVSLAKRMLKINK